MARAERRRGPKVGVVLALVLVTVLAVPVSTTSAAVGRSVGASAALPNLQVRTAHASAIESSCTNCVVGTINDSYEPGAIAYDTINGNLFTVHSGPDIVSEISVTSNRVTSAIAVGDDPVSIAFDSSNAALYVADYLSDPANLSKITLGSVPTVSSIPAFGAGQGGEPDYVVYDSQNRLIYDLSDSGFLTAINTSTLQSTRITVDAPPAPNPEPFAAAFDSSNGMIYVADYGTGLVSVVDGSVNRVVANISVGNEPMAVAVDPADGKVYTYNSGDTPPSVSVISTSTNEVVATVSLSSLDCEAPPGEQVGIAWDGADGEVYVVTNQCDADIVGVIPTLSDTIVGTVPVGISPDGIAYDPVNGNLYVTNWGSSNITIISTGATGTTPSLSSTVVSPASTTLAPGKSQAFSASATCSSGSCPNGLAYAWSLSNKLGTLSASLGAATTFTAGSATGTTTLALAASLNGVTKWSNVTITITAPSTGKSSSSSSPGFLGLSGDTGYLLVAGIAAVLVAVVAVVALMRRKPKAPPPKEEATPEKASAPETATEAKGG